MLNSSKVLSLPVHKIDKGKASVFASIPVIGDVHPTDRSKGTKQLLQNGKWPTSALIVSARLTAQFAQQHSYLKQQASAASSHATTFDVTITVLLAPN